MKRKLNLKLVALATGVLLGRGAYADTLLTFEGTANNLTIPQSYGDFAASSTTGVIVTGNGTPDINVSWSATGDGSPCEWQFYTYYAWAPGVGQLNDCNQSNVFTTTFTPSGTAQVVLNSFSFAPYYNNSQSYDFDWAVLEGATVLTNGSTHVANVSGKLPVDITGTTGAPGQALTLQVTRTDAQTGTGAGDNPSLGRPDSIAIDDISFSEIPGVQPTTTLTFDGFSSDTPIPDSFGDNASSSSTGITVAGGGTPDIGLAWAATGGAGTEWQFYNDGVWSAAQLNSADVGDYYDLHFAPSGGAAVVIKSFNFHGYYSDNERFTFGMEIWDNGNLLTNWDYTFLSDGTKNHQVDVNFTGQPGHELVLSFNRNASTLGGGEVEGDPGDIAVDDISFSEIPGAPPVTLTFSGRTWTPLIQEASGQYSPPQTNDYSTLDANTGIMTGRFGIDTAMTTPLTIKVGDTVSYDYFVTEETRNLRGTGDSTYFGDTGSGFQDGSGNWVGDRNMRLGSSRWEDYLLSPGGATDGYAYQPRGLTQATHVKWTFASATNGIVTLILDGDTTPYLTVTNTLSDIANIQKFRVGLYDSEQDVTLANFTVSSLSAHAAIAVADAPEALWRLDEGGGTIAYDALGGHNATYTGTLTYGITGAVTPDTAVEFSGGYAAAPYSAALNPQGPFTVEAWVKPNIIPDSSGTPCPISSAQFNGDRSGWQIRERDTGYQFVLYNHVGSGTAANVLGGGTPSTTSWTHLVAVYDGTTAYLYVNGSLANSSSAPGFVANYDDGVNAPGPFTIGARSSLDNNFNGAVDEPAFYSRALSAAEIKSHFVDRPRMALGQSGLDHQITWPIGTLQESTNVEGPYLDVTGATSPYTIPMTDTQKFYRIKL